MTEPMILIDGAYGGDQHWFPDPLRREDGCGAVAACDLLAALAAGGGPNGALAPSGAGTREGFVAFMEEMYDRLSPGFFGCWSLKKWTRRVLAWAGERGVTLTPRTISVRAGKEQCAAFLRANLEKGRPVAALNLWKGVRHRYEYGWHWVVITGLEGDRLVLSSWGQRRETDWNEYYGRAHKALCKGGFVTFE